jgi:RsiW-degrading membrane proteinase PrsW (M82 family)
VTALVALAAAAASAAVWLAIIRRYDRLHPEPLKTLALAGLGGGLLAVLVAAPLNAWALARLEPLGGGMAILAFSLFVGFNEEVCKALAGVLVMRRRREVDEPVDGMVYAMTVSLGFAALENLVYMAQLGVGVILVRSLLSVPAHLACGAIWGFGYARARFLQPGGGLFAVMAPYVLWAGLAHAAYDLLAFSGGAGVVLLLPLVYALWRWGARRLRALEAMGKKAPPGGWV